jgi:hypothetical protein
MFGNMDRRSIRYFAEGFLSAFNLFPDLPPDELRFKVRSPDERMRETWARVGRSLRRAMDEVRDEIEGSDARVGRRDETS